MDVGKRIHPSHGTEIRAYCFCIVEMGLVMYCGQVRMQKALIRSTNLIRMWSLVVEDGSIPVLLIGPCTVPL